MVARFSTCECATRMADASQEMGRCRNASRHHIRKGMAMKLITREESS